MPKPAKTLDRILSGAADASLRFDDLRQLLLRLGFQERVRGDHHIFTKEGVEEILNLQPRFFGEGVSGEAGAERGFELSVRRSTVMSDDVRYEIIIYWSTQDEAFIAEAPELPGCAADGPTYREAIAAIENVIQEWLDTAKELGRPIPKPRGRLIFA